MEASGFEKEILARPYHSMRRSASPMVAQKPPYFAVIFTSTLAPGQTGYGEMAEKMARMVSAQPGFLGFDSARGNDGLGITVSYWESRDSIHAWKAVLEHREAQASGKAEWYSQYRIRIAEVVEDRVHERE